MADSIEELKQKIQQLEAQSEKQTQEIEALKKQLKENSESDERRHQEIKALQKSQHEDDMKWKKIGTFTAPLSALATIITLWFSIRGKKKNENGDNEPKDKSSKSDFSGIAEIIRESKK